MKTQDRTARSLRSIASATLIVAALVALAPAMAIASPALVSEDAAPTIAESTVNMSRVSGQRAMEGIVRNDTGAAMVGARVMVGWVEDPERFDTAHVDDLSLASGSWSTYTMPWPAGVPQCWTPLVDAHGTTGDVGRKELTIGTVERLESPSNGPRNYIVSLCNNTGRNMESLRLSGIERNEYGDFVDIVHADWLPDSLRAGESARVAVHGEHGVAGSSIPDIRVSGLEPAVVTLSASTLSPVRGSEVRFMVLITNESGEPATTQHVVRLQTSPDGQRWTKARSWTQDADGSVMLTSEATAHYRVSLGSDDDHEHPRSNVLAVTPADPIVIAAPVAPADDPVASLPAVHDAKIRVRKYFRLTGTICPGVQGEHSVQLSFYRLQGRKWVLKKTSSVATDGSDTYTARVTLPSRGSWRFKASLPSGIASPYRYIRVR